jgi:hypothetical protein
MDGLLSVFYFLMLGVLIRYVPFFNNIPGLPFRLIMLFFLCKILAGISLILVYTHLLGIDTADFNKYFVDGQILYGAIWDNPLDFMRMLTGIGSGADHLQVYYHEMNHWFRPWESPVYNDNRLVIRFNAFFRLFSFGSIYVHNIFINFLSLIGLVSLYRFFVKYTVNEKLFWLPWGVFLFPGLLFWGSGILKEGFLIMAAGMWLYYTDKILYSNRLLLSHFLILSSAGFILFLLKPYNLIFLIPCQIAFYTGRYDSIKFLQLRYALIMILWIAFGIIAGLVMSSHNIIEIIARKQNDFINHALFVDAGSLIHTRYLNANLKDFITSLPIALLNVLTRPHIFEAYSFVVFMAAIENLMIIFMIVYVMVKWDKDGTSKQIIWISLWFALTMMSFVGMVAPISGTFVRYRILALPFLWVAFIHMARLPGKRFFEHNKILKVLYT